MERLRSRWVVGIGVPALVLAVCLAILGLVPNDSPVQLPFKQPNIPDIPKHGPIKRSGSDLRSMLFARTVLPELILIANERFNQATIAQKFPELVLDPARLILHREGRVRIYYVGEWSGYQNSLGINLEGMGIQEGKPLILFPSIETQVGLYDVAKHVDRKRKRLDRSKIGERTEDKPLLPGDFIDLGKQPAGAHLNFFLIASANGRPVGVYTPLPERNPDNIAHMVAVAVEGTPYLLLSFEDMFGGGDKDYSDCIFAVQLSVDNVAALIGRLDPWRRIKQMILMGVIAGIIVGGPTLFLGIRAYVRRRKLRRAYAEAKGLLESGQAREAHEVVKRHRRFIAKSRTKPDWDALEIRILQQLHDVADLFALYEQSAAAFSENEEASQAVGKAQVESRQFESYETLRNVWRGRETQAGVWTALDADSFIGQGRDDAALTSLEAMARKGVVDGRCLARLGWLEGRADPERGKALLTEAARREPHTPDVYLFRGLFLEERGAEEAARQAFENAAKCAPADPFLKDRLAEFLRRHGRHAEALAVWAEAMKPPSLDYIWLKALFWGLVAKPLPPAITSAERPTGHLRPLVDHLAQMGQETFWNQHAFEPLGSRHPEFLDRQEVFWLRVLHGLESGHEIDALSLLNLGAFEGTSWAPNLERALQRILTFRRSGFLGLPASPDIIEAPGLAGFFKEIESATLQGIPGWLKNVVRHPSIFGIACLSAGWERAGKRLLKDHPLPEGLPSSLRDELRSRGAP